MGKRRMAFDDGGMGEGGEGRRMPHTGCLEGACTEERQGLRPHKSRHIQADTQTKHKDTRTHVPCLLGSLGPRPALVAFEGGHRLGHAVCVQHPLLHVVRDLFQVLLLLCLGRHGSCGGRGGRVGAAGDGRIGWGDLPVC